MVEPPNSARKTSAPPDRSRPAHQPLRFLVGPTASGKSALALRIAERTGCELVSLDSMQVYRGMDVGTAKPTAQDRSRAVHHMLDLVSPAERYDIRRYLEDLAPVREDAGRRGAPLLFVGGTAFWLRAVADGLFEGPPADHRLRERLKVRAEAEGPEALWRRLGEIDPRSAQRIHPHDVRRVVRALEVFEQTGRPLSQWQRQWGWYGSTAPERVPRRILCLELATAELDQRIAARARTMLASGWREEALAIRDGPGFGPTASQALGYAEVLAWADGKLEREACLERIVLRTRQFARRQRTWFRHIEGLVRVPAEVALEEALDALGL